MGTGKKRRRRLDLVAISMTMLDSALGNRKDLVLTWEIAEDGRCMMHIFSGDLITPCMRGTLTNRVDLGILEGSSHICLPAPESGRTAHFE